MTEYNLAPYLVTWLEWLVFGANINAALPV